MRRADLVAALVVILAGCNGFVAVDDATPGETVTPAPVPTESTRHGRPTTQPRDCAVPPPATPDRTSRATPATPKLRNGTVDGETLVAIHDRVISNYSYRLRAGGDVRVWTLPNATVFSYQGVVGYRYIRQIYAVGDTLYELERSGPGEEVVLTRPYRRDAPDVRWILSSLSGRDWLEDRIGWYNYERTGTRIWNGTRVRVFRSATSDRAVLPRREILAVNSTVYVDRRGIVRRVVHRERSQLIVDGESESPPRWQNETFLVTDVGSVEPRRPEAFCRDATRPTG